MCVCVRVRVHLHVSFDSRLRPLVGCLFDELHVDELKRDIHGTLEHHCHKNSDLHICIYIYDHIYYIYSIQPFWAPCLVVVGLHFVDLFAGGNTTCFGARGKPSNTKHVFRHWTECARVAQNANRNRESR